MLPSFPVRLPNEAHGRELWLTATSLDSLTKPLVCSLAEAALKGVGTPAATSLPAHRRHSSAHGRIISPHEHHRQARTAGLGVADHCRACRGWRIAAGTRA